MRLQSEHLQFHFGVAAAGHGGREAEARQRLLEYRPVRLLTGPDGGGGGGAPPALPLVDRLRLLPDDCHEALPTQLLQKCAPRLDLCFSSVICVFHLGCVSADRVGHSGRDVSPAAGALRSPACGRQACSASVADLLLTSLSLSVASASWPRPTRELNAYRIASLVVIPM